LSTDTSIPYHRISVALAIWLSIEKIHLPIYFLQQTEFIHVYIITALQKKPFTTVYRQCKILKQELSAKRRRVKCIKETHEMLINTIVS